MLSLWVGAITESRRQKSRTSRRCIYLHSVTWDEFSKFPKFIPELFLGICQVWNLGMTKNSLWKNSISKLFSAIPMFVDLRIFIARLSPQRWSGRSTTAHILFDLRSFIWGFGESCTIVQGIYQNQKKKFLPHSAHPTTIRWQIRLMDISLRRDLLNCSKLADREEGRWIVLSTISESLPENFVCFA